MTVKPIVAGKSYHVQGLICGFELDVAIAASNPIEAISNAADYLIEQTKEQDHEFRTSH
jgi:hypothetical protein